MENNPDIRDPEGRLALELLALGELPLQERRELEAAIQGDPDLAARAARVRDEIERARLDLPAPPSIDEIEDLPAADAPAANGGASGGVVIPLFRQPRFLAGVVAAVAALVLGGLLLPGPTETEPEWRIRGTLGLTVQIIRQGQASEPGAIATVRAGDRLQWTVLPPGEGYLSVFDLQDDGALSLWQGPVAVDPDQPVTGAVQLDDYPGSERVWFVFADEPITRDRVQTRLESAWDRSIAELDTLPGLPQTTQRSLLLLKEAQ